MTGQFPHARDSGIRRLLTGAGSIKLLNAGLGLVVSTLLARMLGASEFGLYSFAIVVASICGVVTQFGLPRLVLRETAYMLPDENWIVMRGLWWWATIITMVLSALMFLGIYLVTSIWSGNASFDRTVLLLAALVIPLTSLTAVYGAALRGLHHVVMGLFPDLGFRQMMLIALLLVAGALGVVVDARLAMAFYVIAAAAALALGRILLSRHAPPKPVRSSAVGFHPAWFSAAMTFALTAGILNINNYTDIFLIGVLRGSEDVGQYRIAQQLSFLPIIGLQIVGVSFSPRFAGLWWQRRNIALDKLFRLSVKLSFAGALLPFIVLLLIGNRAIPAIFGSEFDTSFEPMAILLFGQSIFAAVGPASVLLNMIGKHQINTVLSALSALANVVLNLVLIPMLGNIGAAIATSVSQALLALVTFRMALKSIAHTETPEIK